MTLYKVGQEIIKYSFDSNVKLELVLEEDLEREAFIQRRLKLFKP